MAKNKKTKFSPLFPNKPPKIDDITSSNGVSDSGIHSLIPSLDHRYQTGDASTILFLSKRGMSRSPLAREVLREKIDRSPFFGMCRVSSRGVTQAYDQCPIDGNLRTFADKLGYVLQGYSRFSTLPDLAQADLIIPLDHESDDFTKVHRSAIRGEVRPFGIFLPAGSTPYLDDPYDRSEDINADEVYNDMIHSIRLGCSKILQAIPALIS
ncbi:MAG TPA: hypothetical protein DCF87_04375 [Opitutae bacterium]|nr:hypothetical protein [Opitutae bacterium]